LCGRHLILTTRQYAYILTHLLTYLITPCSTVLFEKLTGFQLVKKFLTFYGTRRFINTFRRATCPYPDPARSNQYPYPSSWRYILIVSYHLCLGLPNELLPSGHPTKTLYTALFCPIEATCPAHFILLNFITRKILRKEYR
jgi:hypothetical protein